MAGQQLLLQQLPQDNTQVGVGRNEIRIILDDFVSPVRPLQPRNLVDPVGGKVGA